MIDWASLLLVNMLAGYVLLAAYLFRGIDEADQRRWSPAFGIVGAIAAIFGAAMTITWPLPGPYSLMYGEMSVLFGFIFLAAAFAFGLRWDLKIIASYAIFAGLAAIILGVRIISLKLTTYPLLSGVGFILSGSAGVFAAPTLAFFSHNKPFRILAALILLATAAIWALSAYGAYWMHPQMLQHYMPPTMHKMK